ncbi:hypothetical protein INH39_04825 [Massilia violaceinigra]|uniref:Response regulatory domain-containing protein n=1 Tax=Massilia violaceinigra TaxID=2045208 RepID=A0ABY4A8D3_9BURK|nr:hypothetical protein [Massilia violaceinigra]UOD31056.1 hypothetical protein INH39_04825 [Massilia violaceinigra]
MAGAWDEWDDQAGGVPAGYAGSSLLIEQMRREFMMSLLQDGAPEHLPGGLNGLAAATLDGAHPGLKALLEMAASYRTQLAFQIRCVLDAQAAHGGAAAAMPRVLLIDGDEAMRRSVAALLEPGCRMVQVASVRDAATLLAGARFRLVVADSGVPGVAALLAAYAGWGGAAPVLLFCGAQATAAGAAGQLAPVLRAFGGPGLARGGA